ncbi:hypothetical protein AYI69_g2611 [Smittium culicis]|uniref:Uncharacterized protein n=1 Tax=Smittium culicis TaxID=133412 RepID=A0A1R1YLX8_9FUNG|nr:hypothetical protein AYI69_g2611 [Smittium culicis]
MESNRGEDAYQNQSTPHSIVCTQIEECGWSLSVGLLTQQERVSIFKEVWGSDFQRTAHTEGLTRASNNDCCDTNMKVEHLVSRPHSHFNLTNTCHTSKKEHTRFKKRKFSAIDKHEMELDSIEDQRRLIKAQDLSDFAVDCILSSERRVMSRSRYRSIQMRFLYWQISKEINSELSAPHIIKHLAEIHTIE